MCNKAELKPEMKEFLIASYFGDVDENGIMNACIERAYLDLARVLPYKFSITKLDSMKKNKNNEDYKKACDYEQLKNKFKTNSAKKIKDLLIEKTDVSQKIREYMKWITEEYSTEELWDDGGTFHYGMAQKWINMTLKYLWLFDCEVCGGEKIKAEDLDVPIDSYIIHAALSKKNDKQPYGLGIEIDGVKKDTSWSTLSEEQYQNMQKEIAKNCSDLGFESKIEWENKAWIAQARLEA